MMLYKSSKYTANKKSNFTGTFPNFTNPLISLCDAVSDTDNLF